MTKSLFLPIFHVNSAHKLKSTQFFFCLNIYDLVPNTRQAIYSIHTSSNIFNLNLNKKIH